LLSQSLREIDKKFLEKSKQIGIAAEQTKADWYLSIGQFGLAAGLLEGILKSDPDNFFAHEKLGYLYNRDGLNQPERAVHHNMEAIRIQPASLFPYINLHVALDHAKHPFDEIADAFKNALVQTIKNGADEMTYGKLKLIFADELFSAYPDRNQESKRYYSEAISHLNKVSEPSRFPERDKWMKQAQDGLKRVTDYGNDARV
jgi:tetratricopeptide (TPR) repeat protein